MRIFIWFFASFFCFYGLFSSLSFASFSDISIHGFISQGYLATDENNFLADTKDGSFQFNEIGINFQTELSPRLRVGLQLLSRDLGPFSNNEVNVDWCYGDYYHSRWLGVRAGRIKMVYGLFGETWDMDMLRTGILLPQSVYPELWRDSLSSLKGVGIYGSLVYGLSYDLQAGVNRLGPEAGFARSVEKKFSLYNMEITEMGHDYTINGTLTWIPPFFPDLRTRFARWDVEGLDFSGSLSLAVPETEPETGTPTGNMIPVTTRMQYETHTQRSMLISVEYTLQNLVLVYEYLQQEFQGRWDMGLGLGLQNRPPVKPQGWYASASYRFCDHLEMGLTYSEYYPFSYDKNGKKRLQTGEIDYDFEAWLKSTTLSARIDIIPGWILKLEGAYNDGFGAYSHADNPEGLAQYWWLFAAKLNYSF